MGFGDADGAVGLGIGAAGSGPMVVSSSNTLILLASALSWTAAQDFADRSRHRSWRRWVTLCAGPAIWCAATIGLSITPAIAGALACLIGATFIGLTAAEIWRCRAESLPSARAALALLISHCALYAARAAYGLVPMTGPGALVTNRTLVTFLSIETLLHTLGMALVLLALSRERAERRMMATLRQEALLDGLTGIPNRRQFDRKLSLEVRLAARRRTTLALLMIDVDDFKRYNDQHGHLQGDRCLQSVASCLSENLLRPGDMVARFGGEEFVVLLPETGGTGAEFLAERLREAIEALDVPHVGETGGRVAVSVGVACWSPRHTDAGGAALIRAADRALYVAKQAGRNTVRSAGLLGVPTVVAV